MERWERRERKLERRRVGMRVSGIGLKKVIVPILERRAAQASAGEKNRLAGGAAAKSRRPRVFAGVASGWLAPARPMLRQYSFRHQLLGNGTTKIHTIAAKQALPAITKMWKISWKPK